MEPWLPAFAQEVAAAMAQGRFHDKRGLQRVKHQVARRTGAARIPRDPELMAALPPGTQEAMADLLRKKPMRSQSGVAIVAVMSSPAACPHGKCVYCPGGPDAGVPQSYTGFEPSTMRAIRYDYDPYRIVRSRLAQLQRNGHPIDKVEVVVQGGTFPARDDAYQDSFIAAVYAACNDGPGDDGSAPRAPARADDAGDLTGHVATVKEDLTALDDSAAPTDHAVVLAQSEAARSAPSHRPDLTDLAALQLANESAACRVVGLTIETKPDWCFEAHVDAMLRHGATRIELGIQTLDEEVTRLTHRGHTVDDARRAMQVARDAGFKVCVHMMPGLPRPAEAPTVPTSHGVGCDAHGLPVLPAAHAPSARHFRIDPAADAEDMRRLFADPDFRPDMLKIYPTLVVQEGETALKRWWQEGRFTPMTTAEAVDVVAQALGHVPAYCRIQRIDRDIPTTHVLAGVMNSNLRQLAEADARRRGIRLQDIRAREVATRAREGVETDVRRLELVTRTYAASGGLEAFLSFEDPVADSIVGFVRVRRIADPHRPELVDAAVVRELKVYGAAQRLGEHEPGAWQHQGLGRRLLAAAQEQASQWGVRRIAVLAGPGVKGYYRRLGYADLGPYLARSLP